MIDFEKTEADYWFGEACRRSRLIGAIGGCIEGTQDDVLTHLTPAVAVARIGQLLEEFHAETRRLRGGDK